MSSTQHARCRSAARRVVKRRTESVDDNHMPRCSDHGLTYFVELYAKDLQMLFERPRLLDLLQRSGAGIAMAMLDLDPLRAQVIEQLNASQIPVTAWLVLDESDGYWLTADNAEKALLRYLEVNHWIQESGLIVEAMGLDIEPPQEDSFALIRQGTQALRQLVKHRRTQKALRRAVLQYKRLVECIHDEGYRVETYQFPLIVDERLASSSLLQRILGIVDIRSDREVLMLYRSLLPPLLGDALIDLFGAEADAIGVGITGGGVQQILDMFHARLLDLGRLLTDLRRARRYTKHLYIFSLEGCVEAGYFEALCQADLTITVPKSDLATPAHLARAGLRTILRVEDHIDRITRFLTDE